MRASTTWTESDLLQLIRDGIGESVSLEFKSSDALKRNDHNKKEIARDVSAFANSGGGTIVYGIRELGGGAFELDAGVDPHERCAEWIEDVIASIQQRIDDVQVHRVALTSRSPEREALVVYVPQSPRAPHQAPDHKFYKRHGAKVLPMEEYEVRDVSRRLLACDLSVKVILGPRLGIPGPVQETAPRWVDLNLQLVNSADQLAEYASIGFWVDHRLQSAGIPYSSNVITPIGRAPKQLMARHIIVPFNGRNRLPVFQGVPVYATGGPISLIVPSDGTYAFKWTVHAPFMRPRSAYGLLNWEGNGCGMSPKDLTEQEFVLVEGLPWEDWGGAKHD